MTIYLGCRTFRLRQLNCKITMNDNQSNKIFALKVFAVIGGGICCLTLGAILLKTQILKTQFPSNSCIYTKEEKLFPVRVGGKVGYINKQGHLVIQNIYQDADEFNEGLAPVAIQIFPWDHPKWGYINACGEIVIQPQFDSARRFQEERAIVTVGDKHGVIDKKGKVIVQPQFQFQKMSDFRRGVAQVDAGDEAFYIDRSGQRVGSGVVPFPQKDLTRINLGNTWGFADKSGKIVISPKFESATEFSEGLAVVEINKKFGYINPSGQIVIPPQFDEAFGFHEGFAAVSINSKWGFINKKGKLVVQPQFDRAYYFENGLAQVFVGTSMGYVNTHGKLVWQPSE